jgi:hypothetical protein
MSRHERAHLHGLQNDEYGRPVLAAHGFKLWHRQRAVAPQLFHNALCAWYCNHATERWSRACKCPPSLIKCLLAIDQLFKTFRSTYIYKCTAFTLELIDRGQHTKSPPPQPQYILPAQTRGIQSLQCKRSDLSAARSPSDCGLLHNNPSRRVAPPRHPNYRHAAAAGYSDLWACCRTGSTEASCKREWIVLRRVTLTQVCSCGGSDHSHGTTAAAAAAAEPDGVVGSTSSNLLSWSASFSASADGQNGKDTHAPRRMAEAHRAASPLPVIPQTWRRRRQRTYLTGRENETNRKNSFRTNGP